MRRPWPALGFNVTGKKDDTKLSVIRILFDEKFWINENISW
jgi:hypothetical protein